MTTSSSRPALHKVSLWASIAALIAGCAGKPPAPPAEPAALPPPASVGKVSQARTPLDYRRDAASHLYALNSTRIYAGKMPPLLYAIGVLQVDINARGAVTAIRWMRAPTQAPEVIAEIERSVRDAAPFPVPVKMGRVTYTDTWLWHKSGRFQLDTLTEGQL